MSAASPIYLCFSPFELPDITENELLVSVISDSVCLSTWKAALLGSEHKRVPDDLE
ncbi:hypothetical protein MJN12_22910, partial [Salmonella enterica subsp. enterica serovar Montevideo]|nr:hypothetical protein [Salmonella enterica subsp. enterica serovar Montevideo]